MRVLQVSCEAEDIGATQIINFYINGDKFCSVPARTRYSDIAEKLAETMIANMFTEAIREQANILGLTDDYDNKVRTLNDNEDDL